MQVPDSDIIESRLRLSQPPLLLLLKEFTHKAICGSVTVRLVLLINAIASFDVIVFLVVLLDRESSHSCVACPPPCPFSLYGSRNICRAERLSEPENLLDCNVSHHRSECV